MRSISALLLLFGMSATVFAAVPHSGNESTLSKSGSLLPVCCDGSSMEVAEFQVVAAPRRVVVSPRPVVVRPRPVVVAPQPVVVVPPPPPQPVVIPDYGYGWWNETYVPCYNNWYWYNGGWVWGGRGPRPVPPRWVPDFRRRPLPPPPPRPGIHRPRPHRPVHHAPPRHGHHRSFR